MARLASSGRPSVSSGFFAERSSVSNSFHASSSYGESGALPVVIGATLGILAGAALGAGSWGIGVAASRLFAFDLGITMTGAVGGAVVGTVIGAILGMLMTQSPLGLHWFIAGAIIVGLLGLCAGLVVVWFASWIGWLIGGAALGLVLGGVIGFLIGD